VNAAPALLGTHERVLRGLWRSARAGRLPHALLLQGPEGIGKFAAARRLAQGLLCADGSESGPCSTCGPCKRCLSDNHLDVFLVDVDHEVVSQDERQERIRLDRIVRSRTSGSWSGPVIEEFLSLRAAEGGWRVLILRDAERLAHSQNEAQNALLKVLEEPGENVLWLLVTSRPEALLATIRSRCVPVLFEALDAEATQAVLVEQGAGGVEAPQLARWSQGSPGAALDLAARGALALRPLLIDVLAGRASPLASARAVWELEGEFQGKTPSARQRDRARAVLDLSLELVADLTRLRAGAAADDLAHGDLSALLEQRPDDPALRACLDALLAARADLERNLDAAGLVDSALLDLAAAGPRGKR
jgi:DNA polymerase III subunit delta'